MSEQLSESAVGSNTKFTPSQVQTYHKYISAICNAVSQNPPEQLIASKCEQYNYPKENDSILSLCHELAPSEIIEDVIGWLPKPRCLQQKLEIQGNKVYLLLASTASYETLTQSPDAKDDAELQRFEAVCNHSFSQVEHFLALEKQIDLVQSGKPTTKSKSNVPVWQTSDLHRGGQDFHEPLRELLRPNKRSIGHNTLEKPLLSLSQRAKEEINLGAGCFWSITLPANDFFHYEEEGFFKGKSLHVEVVIDDVYLYHFANGVKSVVLSLEYKRLYLCEHSETKRIVSEHEVTLEDIASINYAVYRSNFSESVDWRASSTFSLSSLPNNISSEAKAKRQQKDIEKLVSLGVQADGTNIDNWYGHTLLLENAIEPIKYLSLINALLPYDEQQKRSQFQWQLSRPLLYSQLVLANQSYTVHSTKNNVYLERMMVILARKHNYKYIGQDRHNISIVGDEDIEHCICREGGVVLVNPNTNKQSTRQHHAQFLSDTGRHVYLGILVYIFSQRQFLLSIDKDFAISLPLSHDETEIERLTRLQSQLLSFRINYRYLDVSNVNIQNVVYQEWDRQLNVEKLLHNVDQDAKDCREFLQLEYSHREYEHGKKLQKLALVGSTILFLTSLFGINFVEMTDIDGKGNALSISDFSWHSIAILGTILVIWVYARTQLVRKTQYLLSSRYKDKTGRKLKKSIVSNLLDVTVYGLLILAALLWWRMGNIETSAIKPTVIQQRHIEATVDKYQLLDAPQNNSQCNVPLRCEERTIKQ